MSRLELILSLILTLSIIANTGLILYVRAVLLRLLYVSEELGDLQDMINSFATHVKKVYELEMFYGDQTLQALMEHAISFNEQLETFEFIYSITAEENLYEEEEVEEEEIDETAI
jgi:N-methylhydantoinase B/oxoprolinase/acetone carboxylase alpha subunit